MNLQNEAVRGRSAVTEPSRQQPATNYCPSPGTTCPDEEEEEGLVSKCTTSLQLVKTRTMKPWRGPKIGLLLHRSALFLADKLLDLISVRRIMVARKMGSSGTNKLLWKLLNLVLKVTSHFFFFFLMYNIYSVCHLNPDSVTYFVAFHARFPFVP